MAGLRRSHWSSLRTWRRVRRARRNCILSARSCTASRMRSGRNADWVKQDYFETRQSDKTWVWCAQDYADGKLEVEKLALKFGTSELASSFKEAFEDAKCRNQEALSKQ